MKLRNLANKFFCVLLLAIFCWGQSVVNVVPAFALMPHDTVSTKTYYFNQYNYNQPTRQSLYEALGITTYNDYLTALDAVQNLRDVIVAVVDSGLDNTHPVFAGRILEEYAINFSEGINDDDAMKKWHEDHNGHGTHVAGIIADMTLHNVKILPIKIFNGFDNEMDNYALKNAVRYLCALKNGSQSCSLLDSNGLARRKPIPVTGKLNIIAVNMSIGTDGYNVYDSEDMAEYRDDKYGYLDNGFQYTGYQDVIDNLTNNDILPIAAAGNVGSGEYKSYTYYSLPSACEGVLAVSAYDNTKSSYQLADFSYHNDYVGVAAPGKEIWSACSQEIVDQLSSASKKNYYDVNGNYSFYKYDSSHSWYVRQDLNGAYYLRNSGTSMATPYVTACYAMLYSDSSKTTMQDYGLTNWDADGEDEHILNFAHKALLSAAAGEATDRGEVGYDEYFGYGTITVLDFATDTVVTLKDINYELAQQDDPRPASKKNMTGDIDWFLIGCILGVGTFLVWLLGRIRSYFTGRQG